MFGDLPSQLFSPAKMIFTAYVIGISLEKITTSKCEFLLVSMIFFVFEIYHNDYLRIILNAKAKEKMLKK